VVAPVVDQVAPVVALVVDHQLAPVVAPVVDQVAPVVDAVSAVRALVVGQTASVSGAVVTATAGLLAPAGEPVSSAPKPAGGGQPGSAPSSGRSFAPSGWSVVLAVLSAGLLLSLRRSWRIRPLPVFCRPLQFVTLLERPG
jgi:hypothetical protein